MNSKPGEGAGIVRRSNISLDLAFPQFKELNRLRYCRWSIRTVYVRRDLSVDETYLSVQNIGITNVASHMGKRMRAGGYRHRLLRSQPGMFWTMLSRVGMFA